MMLALSLLLVVATSELRDRYDTQQFFVLRSRLEAVEEGGDAETLLLRAAVAQGFNRLETAERYVERALAADDLDAETTLELLRLQRGTAMRRFLYSEGRAAARAVLALPEALSTLEERQDDQNMARLLDALEAVPPLEVRADGRTPSISAP